MALNRIFECDWESCKLYLEEPITLPCGYTVCSSHISNEPNTNIICNLCDSEHPIPNDGFKTNKKLETLIQKNTHLSGTQKEAKNLHDNLENILIDYEKMCKLNPNEYISDYYAQIRDEVDRHRDSVINFIKSKANRYLTKLKNLEEDCKSNIQKLDKPGSLDLIKNNEMSQWKLELRKIDFNLNEIKDISAKMNSMIIDIRNKTQKYKSDLLMNQSIKFEPNEMNVRSFGELVIQDNNIPTDDYGICIRTFTDHLKTIYCVLVDEKSNRLISGSADKTIKIWDLRTGDCLKTMLGHSDSVKCLLLISNNKLVSGSLDNTLRVWDLERYEWLYNLPEYSNVHCICSISDKKFANGCGNGFISVWISNSLLKLKSFKAHQKAISNLKLFNQFELISVAGDCIKIWNIDLGECLKQLSGHTKLITDIDLRLEDGCLITSSMDETIKIWNIADGECKETIKQDYEIYRLKSLSKDLIAFSNSIDKIYIYDLTKRLVVEELVGHKSFATFLTKLNDGKLLSASADNLIKLWKI